MSPKQALSRLSLPSLASSLSLTPKTQSALSSFGKRNADAHTRLNALREAPTSIDFSHYRSVLKNQAVVDEIEKAWKGFKPVSYDVQKIVGEIEKFEGKAIESAAQTAQLVEAQVSRLTKTLNDIENARPVEEMTVQDLEIARPDLDHKVTRMVKSAMWMPRGYQEKYGDLTIM